MRSVIWSRPGLTLEKIALEGESPRLVVTASGAVESTEIVLYKAEAFNLDQTVMDEMRKFGRPSI